MSDKNNETYYESKKDFEESNMAQDVEASLDEAQMVVDERNDDVLPEAPAVANIKVWIQGYGVMLTVRGEKMKDIVKKTEALVDYAISHGWKNVWDSPQNAATSQPTASQAPACGVHGTPMTWKTGVSKKTNKPYAFWSCSTRNADDSFCSYKPEK